MSALVPTETFSISVISENLAGIPQSRSVWRALPPVMAWTSSCPRTWPNSPNLFGSSIFAPVGREPWWCGPWAATCPACPPDRWRLICPRGWHLWLDVSCGTSCHSSCLTEVGSSALSACSRQTGRPCPATPSRGWSPPRSSRPLVVKSEPGVVSCCLQEWPNILYGVWPAGLDDMLDFVWVCWYPTAWEDPAEPLHFRGADGGLAQLQGDPLSLCPGKGCPEVPTED